MIRSSDGIAESDNRVGKIQYFSKNEQFEINIPFIWQSSLTNIFIDDILDKNKCDLPTLDELSKTHVLMINSFNEHLSKIYKKEVVNCPIT